MTPELAALAEDPELYIEPPVGSVRVVNSRYCVVIGPDRRWASVCRLRRLDQTGELLRAFSEIRALVAGVESVVWNVGSSAGSAGLLGRLRALGLRDPDPPLDPVCAAMALIEEPAPVRGVEVRRIATLEEHRLGLEILHSAARWTDVAVADARAAAEDTFERRNRRGGFQWLAWLDGAPVAYALADRASAGLFLAGGATLPEARGRGCYRALVRARWDEAVRLGTPGLAVQAQHTTSAPILHRLGFADVATIHTFQAEAGVREPPPSVSGPLAGAQEEPRTPFSGPARALRER